ncbi:MAG TPA: MarR family transcriptional regulator [Spirochaetota bacterium]|nr:MarR family transcriptional regulator [Spirochaetota bacterium]
MARNYTLIELVEILTRLIGSYEEEIIGEFEKSGLTAKLVNYLEAVKELGNPNLVELSRRLGLSKPSISAIIEKLSNLGFVRKTQSDDDRRSFHLHLTESGEKITRMHDSIHQRIADLLARHLQKGETRDLVVLLNKVVRGLEK